MEHPIYHALLFGPPGAGKSTQAEYLMRHWRVAAISTGKLLREQTGKIHEMAVSSTIPLETLQRAFQNIYDTMDTIDRFKIEALGNMKQTVDQLGKEFEKSKGYIARAEGVEQNRAIGNAADNPLTSIE